jgi:hypothetical protein
MSRTHPNPPPGATPVQRGRLARAAIRKMDQHTARFGGAVLTHGDSPDQLERWLVALAELRELCALPRPLAGPKGGGA